MQGALRTGLRGSALALLAGAVFALGACGGGEESADSAAETVIQESNPAAPGVPTSPEGDNSIQTWGAEASASERRAAALSLQAFLDARATLDLAKICAQVSPKLLADLREQLGAAEARCPQLLRVAFNLDADRAVLRAEARGNEVLSFRVDPEQQAFVIYRDREGRVWAYPMNRGSEGEWKVSLLGPSLISG